MRHVLQMTLTQYFRSSSIDTQQAMAQTPFPAPYKVVPRRHPFDTKGNPYRPQCIHDSYRERSTLPSVQRHGKGNPTTQMTLNKLVNLFSASTDSWWPDHRYEASWRLSHPSCSLLVWTFWSKARSDITLISLVPKRTPSLPRKDLWSNILNRATGTNL